MKFRDAALFALRLIIAWIFFRASYVKWDFWHAAPPGVSDGMANFLKLLSIVEPICALALVTGWFTRWAAAGLAIIVLSAASIMHHADRHLHDTVRTGLSYNLVILAGVIVLIAFGAGRWSVDN